MGFVYFFFPILQMECIHSSSDTDFLKGIWTKVQWEKTGKQELRKRLQIYV